MEDSWRKRMCERKKVDKKEIKKEKKMIKNHRFPLPPLLFVNNQSVSQSVNQSVHHRRRPSRRYMPESKQ